MDAIRNFDPEICMTVIEVFVHVTTLPKQEHISNIAITSIKLIVGPRFVEFWIVQR